MFSNIGEKVKGYSKIIFIIQVIIGVIIGFIQWMGLIDSRKGGLGFLLFLLIVILTFVLAFISSMFIYAFGQLVENSDSINYNTRELFNIVSRMNYNMSPSNKNNTTGTPVNNAPINHTYTPRAASTAHNSAPNLSEIANNTNSSGWFCPKCAERNPYTTNVCKICGASR